MIILIIIKVKYSVFIDYLKSCTVGLSTLFFVFTVISQVAAAGTNVWLSDWSDDQEKFNLNTTNTSYSLKFDKYTRLGVYTALGISQCNFRNKN
jgi:energy-coupling factor transporter transmembrane protein EcfT